jgi:hypothetical protein
LPNADSARRERRANVMLVIRICNHAYGFDPHASFYCVVRRRVSSEPNSDTFGG